MVECTGFGFGSWACVPGMLVFIFKFTGVSTAAGFWMRLWVHVSGSALQRCSFAQSLLNQCYSVGHEWVERSSKIQPQPALKSGTSLICWLWCRNYPHFTSSWGVRWDCTGGASVVLSVWPWIPSLHRSQPLPILLNPENHSPRRVWVNPKLTADCAGLPLLSSRTKK